MFITFQGTRHDHGRRNPCVSIIAWRTRSHVMNTGGKASHHLPGHLRHLILSPTNLARSLLMLYQKFCVPGNIENWNHPPMRLKMFTKTCELESHGLPGLHLNALWRQRFHNPFLMRLQLFRGNKVRAGSHDRNRSKWSPYRLALPQNSCCTPTNKWRSDAHKCMLSIYIET